MITRSLIASLALVTLACQGSGSSDGAPPPMTTLWSGVDAYDAIDARDGFVYVELPGAGVQRCAAVGCQIPSDVTTTDAFVSAALGGGITYTTQIAGDDGVTGEVRAVGVDGSNDHTILGGLAFPAYVATAGAVTFWADDSFTVDDTPATIDCIGCTTDGKSTPWLAGLAGGTYGMIADASNVYVLADDPTLTSVELVSCSTAQPCFAEPRVLLAKLDATVNTQQLASDGSAVYVARALQADVVRIDGSGAMTQILTTTNATALTYDAATASLYYGTLSGDVGRVKTDGSSPAMIIGRATDAIRAIAVDATTAYVVAGESSSLVMKGAK